MDIDLFRTFLEVERVRHFGKAAEHLFVTQSAVSARIRLLEQSLGVALFTRSRNDIQLTPAGLRLKKHAETIVGAWGRARQETGLEPEYTETIAIGAIWDLWDIFLKKWAAKLRGSLPNSGLQLEASTSDALIRKLVDGLLDLVFVFEPPQISGIEIREVTRINLIMVSTQPDQNVLEATQSGYVMVDWGTNFGLTHARLFPDIPTPSVRIGLGALASHHILSCGGAAYLAEQLLEIPQYDKKLFRVSDAPTIERPSYAVYRPDSERETSIQAALACI
jgi:DNA-binding transcriptional LysR family regulator